MGMMGGCSTGWSWGWGLVGILGMIAFWVGIIVVIALIVRSFGRGAQSSVTSARQPEDHALALLRERYARGEMDHEEYEARRLRLMDDRLLM